MRANPGEDTLVLTSESDLERAAMRRWAGKQVVLEEWIDGLGGMVTLAFREASPAGANVGAAPWIPEKGRPVRHKTQDRRGVVTLVYGDPRSERTAIDVAYVDGGVATFAHPDDFEPIATGANVGAAPGRKVRLPSPGRMVRVQSGDIRFTGKVAKIEIDLIERVRHVWVHVVSAYNEDDGAYPPEQVAPIDDDGPWVEVVLPDES